MQPERLVPDSQITWKTQQPGELFEPFMGTHLPFHGQIKPQVMPGLLTRTIRSLYIVSKIARNICGAIQELLCMSLATPSVK